MKFEDIKKFFFKKPKNELEGDGEATASAIPEKLTTKCEKCKQIMLRFSLFLHFYDHGFRIAKASFLAELGLVLRSKIAIAPMAKATKRV